MHEGKSVETFSLADEAQDHFTFSKMDIKEGIGKLKWNIGIDGVHSNHLKISPDLFYEFLSLLFKSFVSHHYVPRNLIKGVINPTIKDKFGNIASSDNYRPVMQSSVMLKLFLLPAR